MTQPWVLVVDDERRPLGWVEPERVDGGDFRALHRGGTVAKEAGSRRGALDAPCPRPLDVVSSSTTSGRSSGRSGPTRCCRSSSPPTVRSGPSGRPRRTPPVRFGVTWSTTTGRDLHARRGARVALGGPAILGLLIALTLGWAARRWPRLYPGLISTSGLLYDPEPRTLRDDADFDRPQGPRCRNVVVAMTIYTVACSCAHVADGARVGAGPVLQRRERGYGGLRRFFGVELPLAVRSSRPACASRR